MKRRRARKPTFECPHCGADVAVGKKVCRECGSDDLTGWQSAEELDYQSIDIPDGYGPEDESTQLPPPAQRSWLLLAVVLVLVIALLLLTLRGW